MSEGKAIPVWFSQEDRSRVEEAAALAGYKHLSKYIRDKALARSAYQESVRADAGVWAEQQEISGRLTEIERQQKTSLALLGMLMFLAQKKATIGEFNELRATFDGVSRWSDVTTELPELSQVLRRLAEEF